MKVAKQKKIERVFIASDHAATDLKATLIKNIDSVEWVDLGPPSGERVDYPDYAQKLCEALQKNAKNSRGVLICGSGIGMSISANRYAHIRAALVDNTSTAKLSREHNDANVLCLGSRFLAEAYATEITHTWLNTPFSDDERHLKRIRKLTKLAK